MHLIAFATVRSLRMPERAHVSAPTESHEVELSEEPLAAEVPSATPPSRPAVPTGGAVAAATLPRRSESHGGAASANAPDGRDEASTVGAPRAPGTASTDPGWRLDVFGNKAGAGGTKGEGALAIPGAARDALSAPGPASTTFGLREGLSQHDTDLGITRGGFVRTAVETAVHSDTAPASGTARYDVRVLRDGTAIVSLENASRDHEGFTALTGTIRKHIDPKKLRLPDGAKGLHVVIDVDIHDQYPDGRKPSEVGKVVAYVGPGEYDITKDGFLVRKMPGASIGFTGKVCSGAVYVGPAGLGLQGGCSAVNAGMPARRMGSARVVSEALL